MSVKGPGLVCAKHHLFDQLINVIQPDRADADDVVNNLPR